jgi:hypothetical protein
MQLTPGNRIAALGNLVAQTPRQVKLGGVLAVLLAVSALVGMLIGTGRTTLLIALLAPPLLLVAFAAGIRYFEHLVLILPLTALTLRFVELPTGTSSTLPASLVLTLGLMGIWTLAMLARREWQVIPTPFNRSLLIFMGVCIISLPWGILWRDPILNMRAMGDNFLFTQIGSLLTLVSLMWVPFLIGRFIDQTWKVKFYVGCFIVSGLLMTATQFFSIRQSFLNDRGTWGLWLVAPLFALLIAHPKLDWRWRVLIAGLILWHLYLVLVRNSIWVSGWLPTLIGMVAIVFLRSRKAFAVLFVIAIIVGTVGPGRAYVDNVVQDNIAEGGLERFEIWSRNFGIILSHWFLGTGPAGYAPYNMTYFPWDARSTHNNHMDILAQFGFVGMAVWLWFTWASCWYGWKVIRRAPEGFLRATAIAALGGWVAAHASMALGDWMLPFAYNQGITGFSFVAYNWIFLGLLVSIDRLSPTDADQPAEALVSV